MKEKSKTFFDHKTMGIVYWIGSLVSLFSVARIHGAGGDHMLEMIMAFYAAVFACAAGMRFSDHMSAPLLRAYQEINDAAVNVIRNMREELDKRDDELRRYAAPASAQQE